MRYQGKITVWKDDKGFGFVTMNATGEKAFVHIKAFSRRSRRPVEGDRITYEQIMDEKHRLRAENIRFVGDQASTNSSKSISIGSVFAALFCLFLLLASLIGWLSFVVIGYYIVASTIAFFAYAVDKSAAQNNRWRTKESTLHFLSMLGGWPGAFLAQTKLRHKSKKEKFRTEFWITVVLNCCLLGWFLTKSGSDFIKSIIGS
ncbi:MAG: cold shock and DUF1294 domain-containing protein [Proteobacteria bacterium]|nr:cold shock and DUF1294 domain-containing protein [Pseudomonadota bacterium]